MMPVLAGAAFANLACMVGVWNWKRWGVVGFCGLTVATLVANLAMGVGAGAITGLVGAGILVALVRPLWDHFR
jgi:hypothetical protein